MRGARSHEDRAARVDAVLVDDAVLVVGGSAETGSSHASAGSDSVFRLPPP